MVIKRLSNGEIYTIYLKLAICFVAGAVSALVFWRLLGR